MHFEGRHNTKWCLIKKKVLNGLDTQVNANNTNLAAANKSLKEYSGSSWSFTLTLWVLLVVVVVLFMGTYILMKIIPKPV